MSTRTPTSPHSARAHPPLPPSNRPERERARLGLVPPPRSTYDRRGISEGYQQHLFFFFFVPLRSRHFGAIPDSVSFLASTSVPRFYEVRPQDDKMVWFLQIQSRHLLSFLFFPVSYSLPPVHAKRASASTPVPTCASIHPFTVIPFCVTPFPRCGPR